MSLLVKGEPCRSVSSTEYNNFAVDSGLTLPRFPPSLQKQKFWSEHPNHLNAPFPVYTLNLFAFSWHRFPCQFCKSWSHGKRLYSNNLFHNIYHSSTHAIWKSCYVGERHSKENCANIYVISRQVLAGWRRRSGKRDMFTSLWTYRYAKTYTIRQGN